MSDFQDFRDSLRGPETQALRLAYEAKQQAVESVVRARDPGASREELREMLVAELSDRGLELRRIDLERALETVVAQSETLGRVRLGLRLVRRAWHGRRDGMRGYLEHAAGVEGAPVPVPRAPDPSWLQRPARAAYRIELPNPQWLAVELTASALPLLDRIRAFDSARLAIPRWIELWVSADGSPGGLRVHIGEEEVGRLDEDAARSLAPAMTAAAARDELAWMYGRLWEISGSPPYLLELAAPA